MLQNILQLLTGNNKYRDIYPKLILHHPLNLPRQPARIALLTGENHVPAVQVCLHSSNPQLFKALLQICHWDLVFTAYVDTAQKCGKSFLIFHKTPVPFV